MTVHPLLPPRPAPVRPLPAGRPLAGARPSAGARPLVDGFGRAVRYLRASVTDRCDFRCTYCMAEAMTFLPRRDLLTLEELDRLLSAFVARGTRKLRITGGEPLVRRDVMRLFRALSRHRASGALDELTLTTNGSRLAAHAAELVDCGVERVNVSLDTLDPDLFRALTRRGDLAVVLGGVRAAKAAGLRVKINAVALRGVNEDEAESLVRWAHGEGHEITFIEVMPMGEVEANRFDQHLPLDALRARLDTALGGLSDSAHRTGGPARYAVAGATGGRVGFITPLTHNFCEGCNRVRVTCTGTLHTCLGQEDAADLRGPLRASADDAGLHAAIDAAVAAKPRGHDFVIDRNGRPSVGRHMSVTGG